MSWEQMALFTEEDFGITPNIIGLAGYAQSGKDTVASILIEEYGYRRMAFADKIRAILYDLNPDVEGLDLKFFVDNDGWDETKSIPQVRKLLQDLGVAVRSHIHPDVWVSAVLDHIHPAEKVVITDVRFINEADYITRMGGQLWRVIRPGVGAVNDHISEHDLNDLDLTTILNNGTLEDLKDMVRFRMGNALTK